MKKYFGYLFKKQLLQTIIITVLLTFIFSMTVIQEKNNVESYYVIKVFSIGFIFGAFLTALIMILRFKDFKNERATDLYFSLPISKKKLHVTQYLFGIVQILISYTVMYMIGLLIFTIMAKNRYNIEYFIFMYLTHIPFLIMFYTLFTFIFLKSNNVIDGFIFVFGWVLLSLILGNVVNIFDDLLIGTLPNNRVERFLLTPFYGSNYFNIYLQEHAGGFKGYYLLSSEHKIAISWIHSAILIVLTGLSMYGGLRQIDKQKTENLGRISTSTWGYYILIPASLLGLSVSMLAYSMTSGDLFGLAFLIVIGFVGLFIFRRGFRIKIYDIALILMPIIIGVIISLFI